MSSMAQQAAELDDQDIWSTATTTAGADVPRCSRRLWLGLRELERELRCLICGHFMHAPVSISPCQHTFCSECIRRHWLRQHVGSGVASQRSCAYCNGPVVLPTGSQKTINHNNNLDACLVPNRTVENIIAHFQKIRMPLVHALTNNGPDDPATEEEELEENDIQRKKAEPVQRLTRMASTFYKGKNKKQLQEICAQQGLSTQGTEKQMQERHSSFVLLHNSECDSFRPRTKAQLVQIIHQREKERARERRKSVFDGDSRACMQRIYQERKRLGESKQNVTWNTILSGNVQFDEEMAEGFRKLRHDLKERREQERKKKKMNKSNPDDNAMENTTMTDAAAKDIPNDEKSEKDIETSENESKYHANQKDEAVSSSVTLTSSESETTMDRHSNAAATGAETEVDSGTSNEPGKIANLYPNNLKRASVQDHLRWPPKKFKQKTFSEETTRNRSSESSESNVSSLIDDAACASMQTTVKHGTMPEIMNPYISNKRNSLSSQQGQTLTPPKNSITSPFLNPLSTGDHATTLTSTAATRQSSLSTHSQLPGSRNHFEPEQSSEPYLAHRSNTGATAEDAIILCD